MNIVIFGGHGFVGSAVAEALRNAGKMHLVNVIDKSTRVEDSDALYKRAQELTRVDAVIYAVGHCPPKGFIPEVIMPISLKSEKQMRREFDMHIMGPVNVYKAFLGSLQPKHFIFVSSAAVRLLEMPRDKSPPLHIYHHLAAIAAQNALIEGMRMDPKITKSNTLIHKVSPAAISDSPFHDDPKAPKSPAAVTRAEVVEAILGCLDATDHQDRVVMKQPPQTA